MNLIINFKVQFMKTSNTYLMGDKFGEGTRKLKTKSCFSIF